MITTIKLSPSTINLFLECPRCFWFEKAKGIKRPRGIFPSLPGGMDRVIKESFDGFPAKQTLPSELGVGSLVTKASATGSSAGKPTTHGTASKDFEGAGDDGNDLTLL